MDPNEDSAGRGLEGNQPWRGSLQHLQRRDGACAADAAPAGAGCWGAGAVLLRPGAADHEVVEASVDAGGQAGIAEGARVAAAEERRALEGALAGDALQAGCVKVVASRARPAGVHRHALGGGGGSGGAEEDRGRRVPWRHLNLGG